VTDAAALLDVRSFSLGFPTDAGLARVLDGVDLAVGRGEIVGLVGESGCGKSTLVRSILGIMPRGAQVLGGRIDLDGENLLDIGEAELSARIRASRIGFVPQDPFQSFNPLFRVGGQILEVMRWHAPASAGGTGKAHRQHLIRALERLGMPDPETALERYPHELSGGQLQRLTIACAMACEPELILADEPTSALDVTTQQQILVHLNELARERQVAVLLVTHDLGIVAQFCDSVAVMYAGQLVETMPARAIVDGARHPYTRMLLACHPDREGALTGIPGIVPDLTRMPGGCRFNPRCPSAMDVCSARTPRASRSPESCVRCWLYEASSTAEASIAAG
jgi:peptide/nickel transport system ATP-binding protein